MFLKSHLDRQGEIFGKQRFLASLEMTDWKMK